MYYSNSFNSCNSIGTWGVIMSFSYLKIEAYTAFGEYKVVDIDIADKSWKSIETILKQYEKKGWGIVNVELTK